MPTPLLVESTDYGDDLASIGPDTRAEQILIVSPSVPMPTLEDGWPNPDYADSQEVHRDTWGSLRVLYGGQDITDLRTGVEVESYQLTEPYGYGPAQMTLPLSPFETWAYGDAPTAKIVHVDPDGNLVRTVWEGFTTLKNPTLTGTAIQCDGTASGRLAAREKLPDLFRNVKHVGRKVYNAFAHCGMRITPYLGADVGVMTAARGITGSYLNYVDSLLAMTTQTDGSQYTILPTSTGAWNLAPKDRETVDFTVHLGAAGVEIDIQDDLTERPNTYYGQGISPENLIWVNGRMPGMIQAPAPPYPFTDGRTFGAGTTDADTDTGDGVQLLMGKLIGTGFLSRVKRPGGYDADVTRAVKALQAQAGLTKTGNVDPDTWDALYDLGVTGIRAGGFMMPLAQDSRVQKWFYTANGSPKRRNPAYDPSVVPRDVFQDFGPDVDKADARDIQQGQLARSLTDKNWSGTITLTSDVFAGSHAHTDADPSPMSRLDIKAGMNVLLRNFDGDTLFHVAVVDVSLNDGTVQLGVDTQARDAATLAEVLERRVESRSNPARSWFRQHRTGAMVRQIQATEDFGQVFERIELPGNEWTVFPVLAGDTGSVSRVRLQTTGAKAAFAMAITAKRTTATYWNNKVPNPLLGGQVTAVYVGDGGSGYTSAPSVSLSGGGGSGATARAVVSGGQVIAVEIKSHGTGYTARPDVSLSGGGGSGASATASIEIEDLWTSSKVINLVDDARALLGAWGEPMQPCGYSPGRYTNRREEVTGQPITGLFVEDAGFDYHTFADPLLYVAVYPDRDTVIKPQRVLWETVETD